MNDKCPNCGALVGSGLKFCPHCGVALPETREQTSGLSLFSYYFVQLVLIIGAIVFGGVGACSTYVITTRQTYSRDLGELAGMYWAVGLIAFVFCALGFYLAWRQRKNK